MRAGDLQSHATLIVAVARYGSHLLPQRVVWEVEVEGGLALLGSEPSKVSEGEETRPGQLGRQTDGQKESLLCCHLRLHMYASGWFENGTAPSDRLCDVNSRPPLGDNRTLDKDHGRAVANPDCLSPPFACLFRACWYFV